MEKREQAFVTARARIEYSTRSEVKMDARGNHGGSNKFASAHIEKRGIIFDVGMFTI
jgi:hypothetical protein